jgi:hypothetical protein
MVLNILDFLQFHTGNPGSGGTTSGKGAGLHTSVNPSSPDPFHHNSDQENKEIDAICSNLVGKKLPHHASKPGHVRQTFQSPL